MFKNYFLVVSILISFFYISNIHAQFLGERTNTSNLEAFNLINVTIGGDFPISGTYPASRTERVDQLITRIITKYKTELLRTTPDEQLLQVITTDINDFAKRDIILKRFSGEKIKVDLMKFRFTGDFTFNPYLKNDDVIIFPALDMERNFIDISGAVNKPIKFQFVEGEKLSDAILIAQGINSAYINVDSASISRLTYDGVIENLLRIKISDNPILQRGDRIRILSDKNDKKDFSVLVLGEVKRPGKVYISKDNTNIEEVINRVGGFTSEASLNRSQLLRNEKTVTELLLENPIYNQNNVSALSGKLSDRLRQSKMAEVLLLQRMSDVAMEDTIYFSLDNKLRALETQGVIDFTKIFSDSTKDGEIKLRDGDVIFVPIKEKYVYVYGQVNTPGLIPFIEGMNYNYYLEKAGGLGEDYEDDFKLIKNKTKSWHSITENIKIERGDYIYIPKDPSRSLGYYLRNGSFIAAILSAVTTISVLIINQIDKN